MKELSLDKMEVMQGGMVCFFGAPWAILHFALGVSQGLVAFGQFYADCWNS